MLALHIVQSQVVKQIKKSKGSPKHCSAASGRLRGTSAEQGDPQQSPRPWGQAVQSRGPPVDGQPIQWMQV